MSPPREAVLLLVSSLLPASDHPWAGSCSSALVHWFPQGWWRSQLVVREDGSTYGARAARARTGSPFICVALALTLCRSAHACRKPLELSQFWQLLRAPDAP
eukprot:14698194-Alexandrium_andersonii.AAC.1